MSVLGGSPEVVKPGNPVSAGNVRAGSIPEQGTHQTGEQMNGTKDFAELKCSEKKKQDIAFKLGLWNSAHEGEVRLTVHPTYGGFDRFRRRARAFARELGLELR